MIGPFSSTLVPLSSSSSVDRQVLINVEASAISPDERQFGFIFTQIPFTRRSDEERKKDQGAWTRSPVLSVCLRPPPNFLAPAATDCKTLSSHISCKCHVTLLCHQKLMLGFLPVLHQNPSPSCVFMCKRVRKDQNS